jgi:hypothetical protein
VADEPKPPLPHGSDAWESWLKPYIRRRIDELHLEFERPGANDEQLRGSIAELRKISRECEPNAPEPGTSGAYFPTVETAT